MKLTFTKTLITAVVLCQCSLAYGATTTIGSGPAENCASVARAGGYGNINENTCTEALEARDLVRRDQAATFVNRGIMRLRSGNYLNAIADFDSAIQLVPDMGEAYVNRGAASIKLGRFDASLMDLNRGLELGVDEPAKAYYNRALAYEGLDDLRAAYFDYRRASEINPQWQEPKTQLVRFTVTGL
jgi:tetratricopeptide (TPR) repeat protein